MAQSDWAPAKQKIMSILKSEASLEDKRRQIESHVRTLPFKLNSLPYNMDDYAISYCSCGYPWRATHKRKTNDSWKLHDLLDWGTNSENDPDWFCPNCRR